MGHLKRNYTIDQGMKGKTGIKDGGALPEVMEFLLLLINRKR
jgi:hypothetical protein